MKKFFYLWMIILIVLMTFGLGEIGMRIYNAAFEHKDRSIFLPDPEIGYVHAAHNGFIYRYEEKGLVVAQHQTNAIGLIGPEVSLDRPSTVFRILILGDSFTEALQIPDEKNFCRQLERLLNDKGGAKHVEVLNAGVSGYSPIAEYQLFRKKLYRLKPDLVIVQLFANDVFEDNKVAAMSRLDQNGLPVEIKPYFSQRITREPKQNNFLNTIRIFAIEHSRLLEFFYVKYSRLKKNSPYHRQMTAKNEYNDGYQFFIITPQNELFVNEVFRHEAWLRTQKYLLALKKSVEESGAGFAIMYIPMEAQLPFKSFGEHTSMFTSHRLSDYLDGLLDEFSLSRHIPFLDLLTSFETHLSENLYLSRDGHLTEEGHKLIAQSLFDFLKQNHAVP